MTSSHAPETTKPLLSKETKRKQHGYKTTHRLTYSKKSMLKACEKSHKEISNISPKEGNSNRRIKAIGEPSRVLNTRN
ncbi:uncharacterized protein G2W53_018322 [Senna tora]|uniref:Uncharacterized protein n=1 Tax=Senna tora TaxID=362788 RepID=A0A834TRI8_9FABA|nr:uncharacterized protein G2W53_018322 [Senna tora]